MSFTRTAFFSAALLAAPCLHAQGPRTSSHYSIQHEILDGGGGSTVSASYAQTAVVGGSSTVRADGGHATVSNGFTGQIFRPVSLALTPASAAVAEGGLLQLQAILHLDDGTTLMSGFTPQWQVLSGPISSISSSGLITAARVHENSSAGVGGSFGSLQASSIIQVANVSTDDFGLYAGDGVSDGWQVQWFGTDNPLGIGSADASGTGQSNLFKYHAGLDPLDPAARFLLTVALTPESGESSLATIGFGPCFEGRTYQLQRSLNLIHWEDVSNGESNSGSAYRTLTDPDPEAIHGFYRVDVLKAE
ncbi:hypothetical protein [Luteolibacter sp. Populi]|uniref:hypothetical protein n=1 Tax=Luteolibacter sp. Populi TaxID=3230487 RepID=UPI00346616C2